MATKVKPSKRGGNVENLTAQQQIFIEALFADKAMNANKAAKAAGYKVDGSKVLENPNVRAILAKRLNTILWEHKTEAERVQRELESIAFMNPQDLLKPDGSVMKLQEMPQHVARTIKRLQVSYTEEENEDETVTVIKHVQIDFWDKMGALEMLARRLGLFQPTQHDVNVSLKVNWDEMVRPHAITQEEQEERIDQDDPIETRLRLLMDQPLPSSMNPAGTSVEVL